MGDGDAGDGATVAAADSTPRPGYEFSPAENEVIAALALNLRLLGWGLVVVVVGFAVVVLGRWAATGVPPADRLRGWHIYLPGMLLFCGYEFALAGRAFRRVVDTQGADIKHLMAGLDELRSSLGWLAFAPAGVLAVAGIVGAGFGWAYFLGH